VHLGALRIDGDRSGEAFDRVLMTVQRDQRGAFVDVEFGDPGRGGERFVVTGYCFGGSVEPREQTAAFIQRVVVTGIERENRLVGGQRLIEPLQTLERAGSISERREIAGAKRERILKIA
jgi:hypothetical protein